MLPTLILKYYLFIYYNDIIKIPDNVNVHSFTLKNVYQLNFYI